MKDIMTKLLYETKEILKEQEKYLKASGEDFNIFSVTKIERYENNTHSAMLAELLNPEGSHHQGDLFLKEFLKVIAPKCFKNQTCSDKTESFLTQHVSVKTEKYIGQKNIVEALGGRIDIMISSSNCCFIIENKIDAPDQERQLERYSNFNQEEKYILYLTLWGQSAPISSAGKLIINEDYYPISYNKEIVKWLENCIVECENPYVNHTIQQYLTLVKKITNQLEKKHMNNLHSLIAENLKEAEQISSMLNTVKQDLQNNFENDVVKKLKNELNSVFEIETYDNNEVSICIYSKGSKNKSLSFGISSFRGGIIYYGIYNEKGNMDIAKKLNPNFEKHPNTTLYFPICFDLKTPENNNLNMSSLGILSQFNNQKYRNSLLQETVRQIKDFIELHNESMNEITNK